MGCFVHVTGRHAPLRYETEQWWFASTNDPCHCHANILNRFTEIAIGRLPLCQTKNISKKYLHNHIHSIVNHWLLTCYILGIKNTDAKGKGTQRLQTNVTSVCDVSLWRSQRWGRTSPNWHAVSQTIESHASCFTCPRHTWLNILYLSKDDIPQTLMGFNR